MRVRLWRTFQLLRYSVRYNCTAPKRTNQRMPSIPYDFGTGRSDPATFPTEELKTAAARVIEREGESFSDYPGKLGHPGFRQAMAAREAEREGVAVDPDHLVITKRFDAGGDAHRRSAHRAGRCRLA